MVEWKNNNNNNNHIQNKKNIAIDQYKSNGTY